MWQMISRVRYVSTLTKRSRPLNLLHQREIKNNDINNNAMQFNYKGWNITVYNDGGMGDRYESKTGNKSATIEP